jgi:hypothetical protein
VNKNFEKGVKVVKSLGCHKNFCRTAPRICALGCL